MKSSTRQSFWRHYWKLPKDVRSQARRLHRMFLKDPSHPSLAFKLIKPTNPPLYSVRLTLNYRALGLLRGDTVTWIWIGPHDEYERLIK